LKPLLSKDFMFGKLEILRMENGEVMEELPRS
jgi:hypothetical protein